MSTARTILRLSNPQTDDVIDVYLPIPVQLLGKISDGLGDDWTMTRLPADAPRPVHAPASDGKAASGVS